MQTCFTVSIKSLVKALIILLYSITNYKLDFITLNGYSSLVDSAFSL